MAVGQQDIKQLENILKKGKMNSNTKTAIREIIKAIKKGDYELAFELSAVKSVLSGVMNTEQTFTEDDEYNKSMFGKDIYSILDFLHHDLAFGGRIPSGMIIGTSTGHLYEKPPSTLKHPIVIMIEKEKKKCWENAYR